jgi:hypothetical protein
MLEMHPEKSGIVYCKDSNRRKKYHKTGFTFLGYEFRPRIAKGRDGRIWTSSLPGISASAQKRIRHAIREWNLPRQTSVSLNGPCRGQTAAPAALAGSCHWRSAEVWILRQRVRALAWFAPTSLLPLAQVKVPTWQAGLAVAVRRAKLSRSGASRLAHLCTRTGMFGLFTRRQPRRIMRATAEVCRTGGA